MKYFLIILAYFIHLWCIGQNTPKEIIINEDTLIGITEDQLKEINSVFIENLYYKEVIDSTNVIISKVNESLYNTQKTYLEYAKLIVLMKEQINTTNQKVLSAEQNISILNEELKQQKKKIVKIGVFSSLISFSLFSTVYFITK